MIQSKLQQVPKSTVWRRIRKLKGSEANSEKQCDVLSITSDDVNSKVAGVAEPYEEDISLG